jgi:beta-galactosidase/beta-glucuronidase
VDSSIGGDGGTAASRQSLNFNQAWQFMLGDQTGAQATTYDDSAWTTVGLPHSFSRPYFLWTQFYMGYGWYRKHFTSPAQWSGKRIFIEFEGAFQDAQVYVNGTSVGEHLGGYTGFSYDITSAVVTGDNVVAVRLNNNWNAQIAPRAGDHTFSGGIYRDVHLVVTDPLHVTWYGTFVTTPTVSTSSATVEVQTEVRNDSAAAATCTVRTDIVDSTGTTVATTSSTQTVAAATSITFDQTTPAIANPSLWHPDHPTLYQALTTLSNGSTAVDTFTTPFGIRSISWTTSGFNINGSHYYLHGVDVHQDHAGWGDGVTNAGFMRDVQMVKTAGFNYIRGSHYPKDPAFVDACDQLGVILWSENPFWGMGGATGEGSWLTAASYPNNAADQAPFEASITNTLTDMIRILRNHPSIAAWSMSNEPFDTATATIPNMRALLKTEVDLTHQLDPTRPAGIGGAQRPLGANRIDTIGDVAGYNGDGATQAAFQNPGFPSIINEYGSVSATRPGDYDAGWGLLASTLTNGFPTEYTWRSGQALWCMFDHGSVGGTSLETMGIVDYFRLPKRAWYWYRNAYGGIAAPTWPVAGTAAALKLTADKTTLAAVDGTDDAQIVVTVVDGSGNAINNNVTVTLSIESGPGEFPTGPSITFTPPSSSPQSDIAIMDGTAAIEFRSYYAGTTVIRATATGLTDGTITITSEGSPAWVQGVTPSAPAQPYTRYAGSAGL